MRTDISIIIVSYNVKPFLERALQTILKALKGIHSEVYVVDNGSGDGSARLVRERFPEIHLIRNKENVGFAKANNQAMRMAKGKMICLLNPDTLVQEDTFRTCFDYVESHPDVGAVGCKILNPDGTLQLACRRSIPTPWIAFTKVSGLSALFPKSRLFGRYNLTFLNPDTSSDVEALSGSFMMVRKEILQEVGYLDETFFLFGEDLDWCYRIRQKGWRIVYLPQTRIIHYKGQSTREAPFDALRLFYQAMRLFVRKHSKKSWFVFPQWILIIGIWIRACISILSRLFNRLFIPLMDIAFLQVSLFIALILRFGSAAHWRAYSIVNVVYSLIWIGCLFLMGLYRQGVYDSSKALEGTVLGLILNTSLTFFFPQYAFSRKVILFAGVFNGLFLSGWRLLIRIMHRIRKIPVLKQIGRNLGGRRVLIIGTYASGRQFMKSLKQRDRIRLDIVGFLGLKEEDLMESINGKVPGLGTVKDMERIVFAHRIHEVIFSEKLDSYTDLLSIIVKGRDHRLHFKMVPESWDIVFNRASMDHLEDIPLVDLDFKIYSEVNGFLKRIMDLFICMIFLPIAIPALIYFRIHPGFKFRNQCISDGEGQSISVNQIWKNGKAVTGWLRYLPLYPEVLKGKMSLVGTEILPFQEGMTVEGFKPGLTGLVQINVHRNLSREERERYTLFYLNNYSLLLDLEILLKSLTYTTDSEIT